jgi:hypothetical protein
MNSVERTVIEATRAYGDTVREIRPLELAPGRTGQRLPRRTPPARRWKTWMGPAAAAAALVALAISLVIVRDIPNGRRVPPAQASFPVPAPRYYVALDNPQDQNSPDPVIVADMRTGKRLATVNPPARHTFGGVTAAADDRTFVLDVRDFPWSNTYTQVTPRSWYLLRIDPGAAQPARLTKLPIPPTPDGAQVDGIALSPDGSKLAVMFQPDAMGPAPGPVTLRIYSVATGKVLHTWTGPTPNPQGLGVLTFGVHLYVDNNTTLSWIDSGRYLAFNYGPGIVKDTTVRILNPDVPGGALLADSRVVLDRTPASQPDCLSLLVTADGRAIECGASALRGGSGNSGCTGTGARHEPGFYEFSAVTGTLTAVLYKYTGTCFTENSDVLWASPAGGTLIGELSVTRKAGDKLQLSTEAGVFSHGKFERLSVPVTVLPVSGAIAW